MSTPRLPLGWPLIWSLFALALVFLEGVALGRPEAGDSLSEIIWRVRDDSLGRFVFIPLWIWLSAHFLLKPGRNGRILDWVDALALVVGFGWAYLASRR
jgi:hypothetical protein